MRMVVPGFKCLKSYTHPILAPLHILCYSIEVTNKCNKYMNKYTPIDSFEFGQKGDLPSKTYSKSDTEKALQDSFKPTYEMTNEELDELK